MAAVLAAAPVAVETTKEAVHTTKKLWEYIKHNLGLTADENYSGTRNLAMLGALAYNDFAGWWDNNLAQSIVGKAVGIRGNLPRVHRNRTTGYPEIISGPDPVLPIDVINEVGQLAQTAADYWTAPVVVPAKAIVAWASGEASASASIVTEPPGWNTK